jgi:hypothetical protein
MADSTATANTQNGSTDVLPTPAPLTTSQKKRAKKKRAAARKLVQPAEAPPPSVVPTLDAQTLASSLHTIASAASHAKAEKAASGEVLDAASLSNTDIAALLAKAREAMVGNETEGAWREGDGEMGGFLHELHFV